MNIFKQNKVVIYIVIGMFRLYASRTNIHSVCLYTSYGTMPAGNRSHNYIADCAILWPAVIGEKSI